MKPDGLIAALFALACVGLLLLSTVFV